MLRRIYRGHVLYRVVSQLITLYLTAGMCLCWDLTTLNYSSSELFLYLEIQLLPYTYYIICLCTIQTTVLFILPKLPGVHNTHHSLQIYLLFPWLLSSNLFPASFLPASNELEKETVSVVILYWVIPSLWCSLLPAAFSIPLVHLFSKYLLNVLSSNIQQRRKEMWSLFLQNLGSS